MQLVPVPTAHIRETEPIWLPLLAKIKDEPLDRMVENVYSSLSTVLLVWDDENREAKGMLLVQFEIDGQNRQWCVVKYCAGDDLNFWHDQEASLVSWAKEHMGCAGIRAYGRVGWQKYAKQYGYSLKRVVVEKEF